MQSKKLIQPHSSLYNFWHHPRLCLYKMLRTRLISLSFLHSGLHFSFSAGPLSSKQGNFCMFHFNICLLLLTKKCCFGPIHSEFIWNKKYFYICVRHTFTMFKHKHNYECRQYKCHLVSSKLVKLSGYIFCEVVFPLYRKGKTTSGKNWQAHLIEVNGESVICSESGVHRYGVQGTWIHDTHRTEEKIIIVIIVLVLFFRYIDKVCEREAFLVDL